MTELNILLQMILQVNEIINWLICKVGQVMNQPKFTQFSHAYTLPHAVYPRKMA